MKRRGQIPRPHPHPYPLLKGREFAQRETDVDQAVFHPPYPAGIETVYPEPVNRWFFYFKFFLNKM